MHVNSADKLLFFALLLLLLCLPLPMGSNRTWAWALMEIGVQLLSLAWLMLAAMRKASVTLAWRRAWPAILVFQLWLLYLCLQIVPLPQSWIQYLSPHAFDAYMALPESAKPLYGYTLSLDPWATESFLLRSWAYFLLFCLVLLLVRTVSRIKLLMMVLVFSGVFQALFGSFMVLSGVEYLLFESKEGFLGKATGTFVNRNHLAGYLNICLALGIGLLVAGGGDARAVHWRQSVRNGLRFLLSGKMRLRIFLVFMAIGLVMTHSRMGNAAFFSSLLITGGIWLFIRRQRPKRGAIIVLGSILVLDMLVMGHWFGLDKVVERLQNTTAQSETRDEVVRDSIQYARDFWLTGSGAGGFYSTYPKYMGEGVRASYRYAHNDYLQFFLETGLIGVVLMGYLSLISLYCAFKAMVVRTHRMLRAAAFASFMGTLAILIHSSVDFNLQIPSNATLYVVMLAMAWLSLMFPRNKPDVSD
jgi:O-antigen ligase